jgi:Na+/proline symporter
VLLLATVGLGIYATGLSKSASDFFVAGRTVNADAIRAQLGLAYAIF